MSREIKFRAYIDTTQCEKVDNKFKSKVFINSEDHWGSMVKPFCMKMFWQTVENYNSWTGVKIDIQQFTGRKDKNGVEIYEGDVIKTPSGMVWLVEPMNSEEKDRNKWGLCVSLNGCGTNYFIDKSILKGEIIGDIYSTPELLKEPIQ